MSTVELSRDCHAVGIPGGEVVTLYKGSEVHVTQALGGTYTVQTMDGLFRIAAKDADAIGLAPEVAAEPKKNSPEGPLDESVIWAALKTCYDPEIPVNIVDLGLVYDLHLEPHPSGGQKVFVKMTLTAPGCGMGPVIAGDAQQKILDLPGVSEATVELVWDPPWHQSMISGEGRRVLGLE